MLANRKIGSVAFDAVNLLFMIALMAAILYPLYYMAIVSISDGLYVARGDVKWLPIGINLETYKIIFADPSLMRAYGNTLLYTSLGTFINVAMTALCAYPLARKRLYGRSAFTLFILFTMFFSGGLIPSYLVVHSLGLVNTIWAIVIPPAVNVWYMIIMRTFFQGIPEEIHESAMIDGANDIKVFAKLILPLSLPVLATMTMFYAVWHWNSFFPSLIYLNEKNLYPVQLMMRNIVISGEMATQAEAMGGTGSSTNFLVTASNVKFGVIIVTILPILAVYPFIQKYFVKGSMVGSLKG
ncbi:MAG: sugar transporter permease [Paenibacillus sp.]|nr:sugar transporter permease [Paenibacillus sp.]